MGVTTIEGIVENGRIRLPASVHLPEKAKVYIVIPDTEVLSAGFIGSPRLVHPGQASDFDKEIVEENLDAGL